MKFAVAVFTQKAPNQPPLKNTKQGNSDFLVVEGNPLKYNY